MKRWVLWFCSILLTVCIFAAAGPAGAEEAAAPEEMYEYRLLDSGEAEIIAYHGDETEIVIPETLGGNPVGSIGENAFHGHSMTSVIIPEGVKAIGNYAFSWCDF